MINNELKKIGQIFDQFKNITLIDIKVEQDSFFKVLRLKIQIDDINDDFNIGIDLNRVNDIERIEFIIKGYLKEEILKYYGWKFDDK